MSEFRDESGRFAPQPEQPAPEAPAAPAGPDWSAFEQHGITPDKYRPDEIAEWVPRGRALSNLDTRQQALQSIYRQDVDGSWLRPVEAEQPDPYAQFAPQEEYEEPEYQQPPALPFDPREFGNVVAQTAEERAYQRVMGELTNMMQQQQFTDAAQTAVQSAGLPPSMAAAIEYEARQIAQQQPHRQAGDIANDIAKARRAEFDQWAAQTGPPPVAGPSTPGGPAPSLHKIPTTFEEAIALSREGLDS